VEDLRDFIMFKGFTIVKGGEEKKSKMYLVPVYEFANEFGYVSV
jgi:hypothetical protein